jgi:hypothetical protein
MRSDPATLTALFLQFAVLSLFAVGGGGSAVPEMHRQTVEIAGSLTDRQFSELFAIAQAAPGPNIMFVALLGHFIAGVPALRSRRWRCADRVAFSLARCRRLSTVFARRAGASRFRPVWCQ